VHDIDFRTFWDEIFKEKFGELVDLEHGGIGFTEMYSAMGLVTVYAKPKNGNYFSVEIKGQGCECLTPDDFKSIYHLYLGGVKIKITRIDFAIDNVPFTPKEFYEVLINKEFKSPSSRKSIRIIDSPYEKKENGEVGCQTVYLGSRESGRMIRVYNKHGFNRIEYEIKEEWAQAYGMSLLSKKYQEWMEYAISCIRQFFDAKTSWWKEFVDDIKQNAIKIYSARVKSINKTYEWLKNQVSPALFALFTVDGIDDAIKEILSTVNNKRLKKWKPIMELSYI
jgi:DNA relaxase NicK